MGNEIQWAMDDPQQDADAQETHEPVVEPGIVHEDMEYSLIPMVPQAVGSVVDHTVWHKHEDDKMKWPLISSVFMFQTDDMALVAIGFVESGNDHSFRTLRYISFSNDDGGNPDWNVSKGVGDRGSQGVSRCGACL